MKLLFNRNIVKFHQHNATLQTRTKLVQFDWNVRRIHLILHFQISTFFDLYEIFLMERTSLICKTHWNQFIIRKYQVLEWCNHEVASKTAKCSETKWHMCGGKNDVQISKYCLWNSLKMNMNFRSHSIYETNFLKCKAYSFCINSKYWTK